MNSYIVIFISISILGISVTIVTILVNIIRTKSIYKWLFGGTTKTEHMLILSGFMLYIFAALLGALLSAYLRGSM